MSERPFLDKNQDGIDDKIERIIDYILAGLILLITTPVFLTGKITFNDYKVALYLIVGLSGGVEVIKAILDKLIKK